jgi:hypothetical protein
VELQYFAAVQSAVVYVQAFSIRTGFMLRGCQTCALRFAYHASGSGSATVVSTIANPGVRLRE